jgi:hypothetical protein
LLYTVIVRFFQNHLSLLSLSYVSPVFQISFDTNEYVLLINFPTENWKEIWVDA